MPDLWLVVDDIRRVGDLSYYCNPPVVEHVVTAQAGIEALEIKQYDELWLDHDLGSAGTIMPLIDWLAERAFNGNPLPIKQIIVHSANPVGAETMMRVLKRWDYPVNRGMFPS